MNAANHKYLLSLLARTMLIAPLLSIGTAKAWAQDAGPWRGKNCAVALTYDDALNVHLDKVIPLLDSLGFKGTFYVPGFYPGFRNRLADWKRAAQEGHELGNHSLFHPCAGGTRGRGWVQPDYDLRTYTVRRFVDELAAENTLLEALDGKKVRTFAYPCGDTRAGDSSYIGALPGIFAGARSVELKMQTIDAIDRYDIGAFTVDGQSADDLVQAVRQAMSKKALLVFLFHGVGGEHAMNVSLEVHRALLYFLKQNDKDIWVAPLVEMVEYVKEHGR